MLARGTKDKEPAMAKFGHNGDAIHPRSDGKECVRPVRRHVTPAHPCSATDVFELDFNNSRMSEARGEGVALRTRQHGQGSLVGSSRSPFHNTVLPRRSRRGRPIPNAHRPKADEDVTVDGIAVRDDVTR